MFFPPWLLWLLFVAGGSAIVFTVASRIGRPQGDYDFFSPMFGLAIIVMWILLLIGIGVGKLL